MILKWSPFTRVRKAIFSLLIGFWAVWSPFPFTPKDTCTFLNNMNPLLEVLRRQTLWSCFQVHIRKELSFWLVVSSFSQTYLSDFSSSSCFTLLICYFGKCIRRAQESELWIWADIFSETLSCCYGFSYICKVYVQVLCESWSKREESACLVLRLYLDYSWK